MSDVQLTKDSAKLIAVIYKLYLDKRKNEKAKSDAVFFAGSSYFHEKYFTDWQLDDIDETFRELSRAGLIKCEYGDNMVSQFFITDEGIIYMENRFKDGMKSVMAFIMEHTPNILSLLIP